MTNDEHSRQNSDEKKSQRQVERDAERSSSDLRAYSIEDPYRLIADSIPQLIWRAGPNGETDFLSQQWYTFTGVSRPDPLRLLSLHQDWQSAIHADDLEAFKQSWAQSVKSGKRFEIECRIHRAGNGYCWHLCRATPVRDQQSRILGWFGTSTYIDNEKRDRESMIHASHVKDHFLAMLSHELRTPLTPAMLIASELETDASLPAHLLDRVQMIHRNIQLLSHLVGDMTDFSAATFGKLALHLEALDLHDAARHALEVCQTQFDDKKISVSFALGASHSIIIGDPIRLQQVIWNLLRNAAKFTPVGGHVEIGSADTSETLIHLWVKDNGMGIPAESLSRIFAPFEQGAASTSHRLGGLGLGLSIARTIAELHLGSLIGQSDGLGKGAIFVLELPLLPRPRLPADFTPAVTKRLSRIERPITILLVEDHGDSALAMSLLLKSFGYHVAIASTVTDALECAHARKFDLVISDIELPDMSGWDFMIALRQFSDTPCIALTGFGTDDTITRSRDAGFCSHLVKPVDPAALRASIYDAVAQCS